MRDYLIIAVMLFSCNSNQRNTEQKKNESENDRCFVYPSEIDSLHIQDLYDSARWYIYSLQCDENYLPKRDTSKFISFGELPLRFDNVIIRHDTLDMNFSFMDKQEPILFSMNRSQKSVVAGVGFNIKAKNKIYMIYPGGNVTQRRGNSRYENPLQPQVINYIKGNWEKLDICFRELAEHEGIKK